MDSNKTFRRIKQRSNQQSQSNQQQSQPRIRIQQDRRNQQGNWFHQTKTAKSEQHKENESNIPTVKILAKSNNNNNDKSIQDTHSDDNSNSNSAETKPSATKVMTNLVKRQIQIQTKICAETDSTAVNVKPKYIKMIDFEFNFILQPDSPIIDSWLLPDINNQQTNQANNPVNTANSQLTNPSQSFNNQSFSIISAVGLEGVGKSSLLNTIAQSNIFETRKSMAQKNSETPLNHVTNGIDLHITNERAFLLDTQPLLSASVLENLIRSNAEKLTNSIESNMNSSNMSTSKHFFNSNAMSTPIFSQVVGFDIAETENFAFMYSLQLLTFLLSVCDHVIIVMDSFCLDMNLLKLLATSLMMVGDALIAKANIVIYLRTCKLDSNNFESKFRRSISTMLGPNVNVEYIHNNERQLMNRVLRPPNSRSLVNLEQSCASINYQSEQQWFQSAYKFWDHSIRKSSLFADYARYLP